MEWTADMLKPILDAAKSFVPIGVGAGVAYFAIVGGAKKGMQFLRSVFKG